MVAVPAAAANGEPIPAKTPWRAAGFRLAMSSCSFAFGNRLAAAAAADGVGVSVLETGVVSMTGTGGGGGAWSCLFSPMNTPKRMEASRFVGNEKWSSISVNSGIGSSGRIGTR